ncbi:hypothetical protein SAMN05421759_1139 [Roseivivax lentus]|uniref:Uncharacterized protein n=1 Tax=Roseivivax lentus TaxID=633194 RepID=A0A1N7P5S2_9RHOB|nr:hypothetical protein SAMN05421759_1139 [Roseivivax lentus]
MGVNEALVQYRLILNEPERVPASYATHDIDRHAFLLAECEARLARAIAAERSFLCGRFAQAQIQGAGEAGEASGEFMTLNVEDLRAIIASETRDIAARVAAQRERAFWREAGKLQRYRREAETARRRALKAYTKALLEAEPMPLPLEATER